MFCSNHIKRNTKVFYPLVFAITSTLSFFLINAPVYFFNRSRYLHFLLLYWCLICNLVLPKHIENNAENWNQYADNNYDNQPPSHFSIQVNFGRIWIWFNNNVSPAPVWDQIVLNEVCFLSNVLFSRILDARKRIKTKSHHWGRLVGTKSY